MSQHAARYLLLAGLTVLASTPSQAATLNGGPYATLSDSAKQRLRDKYEDLAADDEPPYPLEGMDAISDALDKMIPVIQPEGTLFAAVEINEKGEATGVSFHSLPTSHAGATEAQMRQLYALPLVNARYKPALCKGKACNMAWPIMFEITRVKTPERAGPRRR
ncbi:MAG: hypothetical protein V4709_10040 [Pseudomonadota bacterium]